MDVMKELFKWVNIFNFGTKNKSSILFVVKLIQRPWIQWVVHKKQVLYLYNIFKIYHLNFFVASFSFFLNCRKQILKNLLNSNLFKRLIENYKIWGNPVILSRRKEKKGCHILRYFLPTSEIQQIYKCISEILEKFSFSKTLW